MTNPENLRALRWDHRVDALRPIDLASDAFGRICSPSAVKSQFMAMVMDEAAVENACEKFEQQGFEVAHRPKDKRHGLSRCLPSDAHVVCIRAEYKRPGQVRRGLRDLFAFARRKRWRGVVLAHVTKEDFENLEQGSQEQDSVASPEHREYVETGDTKQRDRLKVVASPEHRGYVETGDTRQLEPLMKKVLEDVKVDRRVEVAFVGRSAAAEWVRRQIMLAASTKATVLIMGETGTGKEVVARQIHEQSGSWLRGRLIAVNCAAIAKDLLESELFGHLKGAFTGALCDKTGLWAAADNGTLFLDEIGDLSLRHQAKILRALEDGGIRKVGDTTTTRSDARLIAATTKNLNGMVESRKFRRDLYERLMCFPIRTPALREHLEDLKALAEMFWESLLEEHPPQAGFTRPTKDRLPAEIIQEFARYDWPGNARELRSFLFQLLTLAHGREISRELVHLAFAQRSIMLKATARTGR